MHYEGAAMRPPSSRIPLDRTRCLFCAYRLHTRRSPLIIQQTTARRSIQTSHPTNRPAQAAAAAAAPELEEPEEQKTATTKRPSWGFMGQRPPTTYKHQQSIPKQSPSQQNLQPPPPKERQHATIQRENAAAYRQSRPQPGVLERRWGSSHLEYAGSRGGHDEIGGNQRRFRPQQAEPANRQDQQRSQGSDRVQMPTFRRVAGLGMREPGNIPRQIEVAATNEGRLKHRRHLGQAEGERRVAESTVPDPWALDIPSKPGATASTMDGRNQQKTGTPQSSGMGMRKESPHQTQREAYRQARADNTDRFFRQKARQRTISVSKLRTRHEDDDVDAGVADRIDAKRVRKAKRKAEKERTPTPIDLPDYISISNLATALKVRVEDFTSKLQQLGFNELSVDHVIDAETAGLVASEFNFEPTLPTKDAEDDLVAQPESTDKTLLLNRPPVITIMGHVDHGKTTLLDWLRKSSVVASEYGGITQHIGAFTVPMPSGRDITFLDTPGHAAFLSMRARGANVTDIVILVVAADDSVKPQTIEAIKHAKESQVPIIVAINKMDKLGANAQRVKEDLARHGIEVEDFGGDVQTVEVSGKTGEGMENLEEAALALSDILDVRAPTDGAVEGWVIESSAKRAGKIATVLVRRGTLTPGAVLVAGTTWTRVRTLHDANGEVVDAAGPAVPVLVDGWREQPEAGDEVLQATGEARAKRAVEFRQQKEEDARLAQDVSARNKARSDELAAEAAAEAAEATGEDAAAHAEAAAHKVRQEASGTLELPLVLRADVSGSVEAVEAYLQSLASPLIRPNILRALVGPATPSDVTLAELTRGALVSFNVPVPGPIALAAERAGVPVLQGNVIYRLADDVKAALEARLPEKVSERVLGEAEILQVFTIGLGGGRGKLTVAGLRIGNGAMKKGGRVRVVRGSAADPEASDLGGGRKGARRTEKAAAEGERVVFDGHIATLRSHKKEVAEMQKGKECGLSFDGAFAAFEAGDRVVHYEEVREKQTL